MRFRWNNSDKSEEQNKLLVSLFIILNLEKVYYTVILTYIKTF